MAADEDEAKMFEESSNYLIAEILRCIFLSYFLEQMCYM